MREDDVMELALRILRDGHLKLAKACTKAYLLLLKFYGDEDRARRELEVLDGIAPMTLAVEEVLEVMNDGDPEGLPQDG